MLKKCSIYDDNTVFDIIAYMYDVLFQVHTHCAW